MPRCPSCNTHLTRVEEGEVKMATCSGCFGTWMVQTALLRLVRTVALPAAVAEADLVELAAVVSEADTKKTLRCPECSCALTKDRFHPMIPVTVDRCGKCNGVWMDVGELPLIRRLFEEVKKTDDPRLKGLQEKLAMVNLEFAERNEGLRQKAAANHRVHGSGAELGLGGMTLQFLVDVLKGI